jgi:Ca2+-binding EF-hand superfamily protein
MSSEQPTCIARLKHHYENKSTREFKKNFLKYLSLSTSDHGKPPPHTLTSDAFKVVIKKTYSTKYNDDEIHRAFCFLDVDGDGLVSCRDFVNGIRVSIKLLFMLNCGSNPLIILALFSSQGTLNAFRHNVVLFAFSKLDSKSVGYLADHEMQEFFKKSVFPEILSGKVKPKERAREWLEKIGSEMTGQKYSEYKFYFEPI